MLATIRALGTVSLIATLVAAPVAPRATDAGLALANTAAAQTRSYRAPQLQSPTRPPVTRQQQFIHAEQQRQLALQRQDQATRARHQAEQEARAYRQEALHSQGAQRRRAEQRAGE